MPKLTCQNLLKPKWILKKRIFSVRGLTPIFANLDIGYLDTDYSKLHGFFDIRLSLAEAKRARGWGKSEALINKKRYFFTIKFTKKIFY